MSNQAPELVNQLVAQATIAEMMQDELICEAAIERPEQSLQEAMMYVRLKMRQN